MTRFGKVTFTQSVGKLVSWLITIVSRASFEISVNFRFLLILLGVAKGQQLYIGLIIHLSFFVKASFLIWHNKRLLILLSKWYLFAIGCYAFLLFFTHANFANPNRFHFNLNWKRVGKQRVVYSSWQLLTLQWLCNKKKIQFAVLKLNFSPRIRLDLWK